VVLGLAEPEIALLSYTVEQALGSALIEN